MITLSLIKNASGAAKYYVNEDNYYLAEVDAKETSEWLGKGVAELGLAGKVEEQNLQKVLEGKLPNGVTIGLQKDGKINHRPGYDICFHAPKSVSILALEGKDKRFYDAHVAAVKETLVLIERDCAQAKIFKEGKLVFQNTKNLSVALVKHTTSRDLDPQLHHHALVMNVTKRNDGKWRALASSTKNTKEINGFSERLYKNRIYYGLIYQSSLANKVVELGCEIEPVGPHGLWEIKGVPKEAREVLSKRRKQIEEQLNKLHYKSLKAADVAALDTREKKIKNLKLSDLREAWKTELASVGFSSQEFITKMDEKKVGREHNQNGDFITKDNNIYINDHAREAIGNSITHLSHYNLKLDYAKILSQALEFSIGTVTHKELIGALNDQIKNGALIPIDKDGSMFVTKELLDIEKGILDFVAKGKKASNIIYLNTDSLNKIVDGEIKDRVVEILQSKSRINLVESRLNNNTEFISNLLNLAESSGKTVRILSPNRATASDINENIRRKPNTIWQWLISLGKPELGESVAGFKYQYARELELPLLRFRQEKDVILIHDAETLGAKDTLELLQLTERSSAKVIFLRNVDVRSSLSAGNAILTLKQAGIDSFDIEPNEKVESTIIPALTVVKDSNERTQVLARIYANKEDKERDNTIVLVGSKERIKTTNVAIREELKRFGKLSEADTVIKVLVPVYMSNTESGIAHRYQKNMTVRFYNRGSLPEDWKIESINKERNLLRLTQDGKRKLWSLKKHDKNYSIFKEEELYLTKGDKIVSLGSMNLLRVKSGTKYTVGDIGDNYIKLLSNKKTLTVSLKDLYHSHFQYNYATVFGKYVKKEVGHILADFNAYSLDKLTFNELTKYAKDSLIIFTNDKELADKRLGYNSVRLTAVEAILNAGKISEGLCQIDRVISNKTIDELKQDIEKASSILKEQFVKSETKSIEAKAVDFAIEKITSRNAGFTHKELVAEALTYALRNELSSGNTITHEAVMKAITEKRSTGELIMGKYFSDGTRWTTKELLELEHSIIENIKQGKDKLEQLFTPELATKMLSTLNNKDLVLTTDQKNACHLITTTKDQFVIVQGYAGTGKTTMFGCVQKMLKEHAETIGQDNSINSTLQNITVTVPKILSLAPTHRAVKELIAAGIESQTLKSFLIEQKEGNVNSRDKISNNIINEPINKLLDNTIIILDEASMVSNKEFVEFLDIVCKTNSRVVLSGDIAQHISVESGKPFEIIQKANLLKTVYLKEIVRQNNPNLKEAVKDIIHGDYEKAFDKIASENPRSHIERSVETPFFEALKSSIIEVDNNKLKTGEKTLENLVAEDFLTRTPEIRDNTVVIVHANSDRKVVNNYIREGLKEEGVVAKKGIEVNCLVSKNLTAAENKVIGSYQIGDVIKFGKKYYHVVQSDLETRSLLLEDEENNSKLFYPEKYAKKYNLGVYEKNKAELAVGDNIRLTKTDKERKFYANFKYKVTEVNESQIILEKFSGDKKSVITLNPKELKDAHWDYAYTVTGYGIQGGSKSYAIDFEVSYKKNLANQRSFYIGASRAVNHLVVYTDNKERLLERIITNKGDKYSALEVSGDLEASKYPVSDSDILDKQNVAKEKVDNKKANHLVHEPCYDAKEIVRTLNGQAEIFIERFLGSPNQKLSSSLEWRYGNKGSLVISMSGEKRGLWHNFETGESGNLLTLIQKEAGLSFKDTLKYVAGMFGEKSFTGSIRQGKEAIMDNTIRNVLGDKEHTHKKTSDYAKKLYEESLPIFGTLAERYLKETRGINYLDHQDLRYHPKVYIGKNTGATEKYSPAMLAVGRDKDNNIQCIQATYLNPKTAQKTDLDIKKRTYSSPSGASVLLGNHENSLKSINVEKNNSVTFIAEGVETGLSIKDVVKEAKVFVTLGKSNFVNIDPEKISNQVVFCLDNDGSQLFNDPVIHKAAQRLLDHGKEVFISVPQQLNNSKTDFNDVAKIVGVNAIRDSLNNAIPYDIWKTSIKDASDKLNNRYAIDTKVVENYSSFLEQKSKNLFSSILKSQDERNKSLTDFEHGNTKGSPDNIVTKTEIDKMHQKQIGVPTQRQDSAIVQKTLVNIDREL